MASVLQVLFSLPAFQARYWPTAKTHAVMCPEPKPASCLECQVIKVADGLLSGRYSKPREHPDPNAIVQPPPADAPVFQEGIKPTMFKALIGKGHEEFSTMRQQDSEEFLEHLLKTLRQETKKKGLPESEQPTEIFKFGMQQRLQCLECKKVRYRVDSQDSISIPVPATEVPPAMAVDDGEPPKVEYEPVDILRCLGLLVGDEVLEYACPSCAKNVAATK